MPEAEAAATVSQKASLRDRQMQSCAVLVVSCDRYRDLWTPFFALFWRYWPDCPFPVCLGSNFAKHADIRVKALTAGDDQSWSKNLRFFLEQIDSQYVLLLLEDFFLNRPMPTSAVLDGLNALHALNGTMLRLYPHPRPNIRLADYPSLGSIHYSAPYRVSAQPAIWNRTELLALLRDHESAWEFEREGTIRSQAKPEGFFSTYTLTVSYDHVVERGQWFRSACKKYRRQEIGCDFTARPVMTRSAVVKKRLSWSRWWMLDRIQDLRLSSRARKMSRTAVKKTPRVAFLTNIIPPYHKRVLDILSARLGGMRVLLSTPMESNRSWKLEWDGLDVVVQKTITLRGRWRHPKGFSEPLAVHLPVDTVQQLKRFGADVVISSEMGARTLLALLYCHMKRQSKLIVWAEVAESTEQGRGRARQTLRRVLHRRVDAFLVTGESGARYLRSLGVNDKKIFKISYTTDIDSFTAIPLARNEAKARRLLYVGQLVQRKGLERFINVLSKWAAANQDGSIEFVLAGDGPLRAKLEQLPVHPNVKLTFSGSVSYQALPETYRNAGILVLPTLADTWGVVVNEALAAGLPVLGSVYSQAVAEMVSDEQNGWVFRADNPNEMYNAIDRALRTPLGRLEEMRECARKTAARLTPDYVAGLIEGAVNSCWNRTISSREPHE